VEKPSVPHQYNLSFTDSLSEYVLDIVTIEHEVPDASPVHIPNMEDLAMRNIKRFSRSKGKDDIKAYVDQNLTMGSQFALMKELNDPRRRLALAVFGDPAQLLADEEKPGLRVRHVV
jgi:hypothetical protein